MDGGSARTFELVRAAQAGDRRALEDLFARYLPRVRQIVALRMGRRLRELEDVDDVAQDVLLKAFQGLERFEQRSEGAFRNWLAACVECEIADKARRAGARKRGGGKVRRFADCESGLLISSVFAGREPTPSAVARARELAERIEEALIALPRHHREVVILRNLCEMSYEEIAETMALGSAQTARKAVSRALRKLKESLEP
jgi:RNA polymerase sigma-70 factor (subfamily 1)